MNEVVETAPEVVYDLANPNAPHWIGFFSDIDPDSELFRLSVELKPGYVRVALKESCDFRLESVQLAPGPFTFEPYPV